MPSSPQFISQILADLQPHLAGDQLTAAAEVTTGRALYAKTLLVGLPGVAVGAILDAIRRHVLIAPHAQHPAVALAIDVTGFLSACVSAWATLFVHRPAVVAVTPQRVLCCELTRLRKRLKHFRAAPLDQARITGYRNGRRTTSVTVDLLGAGKFRLHAESDKRRDLNRVLAAAGALGVVATAPATLGDAGSPAQVMP
jgi:hypothetical protein